MPTKPKSKQKSAQTDSASMHAGKGDHVELLKLLVKGLKDLYCAENHLVKALPKMKNASSSRELREAIGKHVEVTRAHVGRLEQVFKLLGEKVLPAKCDAIEGLTLEGEAVIEDTDKGSPARELGINLSCQKVEYYEMAAYAGLAKLAASLGYSEVAMLLTDTFDEEQENADLLTEMSEALTIERLSEINLRT
jgi:ferritin-like metal-binding protein YciE